MKELKKKKLLIFIIAYNAENHIENVLNRIPDKVLSEYDYEILIIDDSSIDKTFEIAQNYHNINSELNLKILYNPKAILWHKNAGSVGGSGSSLQDYYITRNRMVFGIKYAPLRSKISLIRESLRLLLIGRAWQKRGIADFYLGRFGKGTFNI